MIKTTGYKLVGTNTLCEDMTISILGSATLVLEAFQKSKHSTAFRDNRPKMYNLMINIPLIMPCGKKQIHLYLNVYNEI